MFHSIYIAGAEPHSGKSVVVLGMMEMLIAMTPRVGFFRPVIADDSERDPLIHLVAKRYGLEMADEVLYGCSQETARDMIAQGRHGELLKQILAKYKTLQAHVDVVVCAGTDFTDPSSALELDFNATLANHFGCLFLPVVKGLHRSAREIADAVRMLEEHLEGAQHCKLLAAFANRVPAKEMDELGELLKGTRFPFYILPENQALERPTVAEISRELGFECLYGNRQVLNHGVARFKVAAMQVQDFLAHMESCSLVLTPGDRSDIILGAIAADCSGAYPMIAGILLTGGQKPAPAVCDLLEGMHELRLPILVSPWDTFNTALKVNDVKGMIMPSDDRKIAVALGLMESRIDMHELRKLVINNGSQRMTPLMFEYELIQRAKSIRRHIVLPESDDERILRATEILSLREVVKITLLGDEARVRAKALQLGVNLGEVEILDPRVSPWRQQFADAYFELRKHKNVTQELAYDTMVDVSYFGTMMVHFGYADGMVSGAAHTTQHTIRPAFEIIKTKPGNRLVSSVFFMCLEDRVLVYGDCAVNPNPNAEQLADIAVTASQTAGLFGIEPRTAMLSYSSGTSGKGDDVEMVREAVGLAQRDNPRLKIDGPIQYDAAVDASVASSKMPDSEVAGKATVFIFPDLNTGNNTYKAVQRSAGAVAIGPALQGLNKPVNDLSRGCSVTDIVNTVAITAIQAQQGTDG